MNASAAEAAGPPSGAEPARARILATSRQVQELWFALARTEWTSLAIVPGDVGQGAPDLASALAEVGSRFREQPVRALTADASSYEHFIAYAAAARLSGSPAGPRPRPGSSAPAAGQVIVAVEPIIQQPLGLAVLQAVDAVLICVQIGHARLETVRRTLAMIGRERVVGYLAMHAAPRWWRSL